MKPLFIISCPIDTYSGYGARSRDVVKAIIELEQYDVKILPQRWGNCPWGFIQDHPEWEFLTPYLLPPGNQIPSKPKIWAQISVPNEFQPIGEYNIGFTAGIETTVCDPSWIEGLNRMDLNIVSSNHAKETFVNSNFEERNSQNNQIIRRIGLNKPVEVLFEGADLTKYFPSKEKNAFNLNNIKEKFAFLSVGHWMQGDLGEDRKNIGLLIKTFYETFKNQKNTPALILKTSGAGASYMDRDQILDKITQIKKTVEADTLPNIYLLHGELNDKEINDLYNHKKVKAMVSLTKGEGFGRPLLEFSLVQKPVITTHFSGHLDFLDKKYTMLIDGEIKNVHKSAAVKNILLEESGWFSPKTDQVVSILKDFFKNPEPYQKGAKLQYHKSKNNFSFKKMKELLDTYLVKYVPEFPEELQLTLPNTNLPKLSLPKLKKLENEPTR